MALEFQSANAADVGANKFLLGIDEADPQNPVPFKHAGVANLAQLITDAQTAASDAATAAATAQTAADNAATAASTADGKADDALANMVLQPEIATYYNDIIAAGGYIKTSILLAYDTFVSEAKREGLWAKIVDFAPLDGSNLAAALIKLKYPTGLGTLVNTNLVEADYQPGNGFVLSANTNKFLGTGLVPSAHGLNNINIGIGGFVPVAFDTTSRNIAGLNPATGNNNVTINNNGGIGDTARMTYNPVTRRVMFQSLLDVSWLSYNNAVKSTGASAANLSFVTQYPLDTELTMFKTTINGAVSYTTGSLGGLIITEGLTDAETEKISALLYKLYEATGRMPVDNAFSVFSDSNGRGQNINPPEFMYAERVSKRLGRPLINISSGGSAVRIKAGNFFPAIEKYLQIKHVSARDILVGYGTNDFHIHDVTADGDAAIIADYQAKLETVFAGIKANNQRPLAISPPYNTAHSELKTLKYVDACLAAAVDQEVIFMDAYTIFSEQTTPGTYFADTLHWNSAGHAFLTEHIIALFQGRIYREPELDFPSIASLATADLTVTMRGARAGMKVDVNPPSTLESGLIVNPPFVSADDTVTVRLTNITAGPIDPAAGRYTVSVQVN